MVRLGWQKGKGDANQKDLGCKKVRGQSEATGGQVTKPIILVKIYYKILYVI